jgi:hypothetical protein
MYSLVQEMGRIDRNPLEGPGDNQYEVHIAFLCLVMLYLRIMQHSDPSECNIQLSMMFNVLKLLVIPNECQHMVMANFFENPSSSRLYHPCGHKCSYCKRDNSSFTGQINRTCTT